MNIKSNLIYVIGTFINAGIPFLFLPILTRYLSAEEYGSMNLLVTLYTLALPLVSISFASYLYRVFFENKLITKYLYKICLAIVVKWAIVIAIITTSIAYLLASVYDYPEYYALISIGIVLSAVSNAIYMGMLNLFSAMNKPASFIKLQILYTSTIFAISLFFIIGLEQGFIGRLYGIVVTDIIFAIVSSIIITKSFSKDTPAESEVYIRKDFIHYGAGLVPHAISAVLLSSIDKLVIASKLSIEQLGLYAVAIQFASILMIFTQGISKEWARSFLSQPYRKGIYKTGSVYVVSILVFAVILFSLKGVFYFIFVGDAFTVDPVIIGLLLCSQVFHCVYMLLAVQISLDKKTYLLSAFTFLSVVINLATSLSLISSLGIYGVVIGTLLGMASKFILVSIYVTYSRVRYQQSLKGNAE